MEVSLWRYMAMIAIFYAFVFATAVVFGPSPSIGLKVGGVFIPLLVAFIYANLGLWRGVRYLIVGIGLAVVTLGGYFFLREHFLLLMAFGGGGSLILTGFWLRQA